MFSYKLNPVLKPFVSVIDSIGSALFFNTKLKKFPSNVNKILLIRVEHIGDVILATPAFRALKEKYPDAKIDVLVRSNSKIILEGNKNVKAIEFNPPWLAKGGSLSEVFSMIPKLKKEKYDIIIDMHGDPRNILLSSLIGGYRIGFGIRGFGFLLNKVVKWDEKHIIERNLDLTRSIGADTKNKQTEIILSKEDLKYSNKIFSENKITNAVCINPGAGRKEKMWTSEGWADVADYLIEKGFNVIFTGSRNEIHEVNKIKSLMNDERYIDLTGKTDLKQMASIIKRCKLVVGPDTGPIHIAKAVKTSTFAIFGPENPNIWGYDDRKSESFKVKDIKNLKSEVVIKELERFLRKI